MRHRLVVLLGVLVVLVGGFGGGFAFWWSGIAADVWVPVSGFVCALASLVGYALTADEWRSACEADERERVKRLRAEGQRGDLSNA